MLSIFHKRKSSKNLVVFIHGLNGGQDTWWNNTYKSFPELLLEDKTIKNKFDFSYFEYATSLLPTSITVKQTVGKVKQLLGIKARKIEANLSIDTISNLLLTHLETNASGYKSIFIVAHSMGGLIAKSLVVKHSDKDIVKKIKLIVSLAVPHNGANLAAIGSIIYPLLQIKNLAPLNDDINFITQGWINNKDINPRIVYFQGSYDNIVNSTSSVGYDANNIEIKYCNDDHSSIAKPESTDSIVCATVRKILLDEVKVQTLEQQYESEIKPDLTELEDEDFVIKLIIADVNERIINNAKRRFYEAEITKKLLFQLGMKNEVTSLYQAIEQIYHNAFADVVTGKIEDGNALVSHVHHKITEEHERLLNSLAKINFTQKIGMMHQIANIDDEIWWARNHSVADIEEYKRLRGEKLQ
jgi:triacylglycerol esterase/lipase EstA (alpha/beta hydrolase family)